jgi:hypothetical protein
VENYMFPGEGTASGVCTGEDLTVLSVITGVSIIDSGEKSLVFGCYPQSATSGGAGLIQAMSGASNKNIDAIRFSESELLRAGSVFTVDSLPATCSFNPKPTHCIPPSLVPSTPEPDEEPEPTEETTPEEEEGTAEGEAEGESEKETEPEEETGDNGKNENDKAEPAGANKGTRTVVHSLLSLVMVLLLGLFV